MASATAPTSALERLGVSPSLAWGYPGLLLFMVGEGVESGILSPYLLDHGVSHADIAFLLAAYGLMVTVSGWLTGALSELYGPRRMMWSGFGVWITLEILFLFFGLRTMDRTAIFALHTLRGFGYPLFAFAFQIWLASETPESRLGRAMGWYGFSFTAGFPVVGSLLASLLVPRIGVYATLWSSLASVVAGGLMAIVGTRSAAGGAGTDNPGANPLRELAASITLAWKQPAIAVGCVVRVINTAPQFGFVIFLPTFFLGLGFTLAQWLRLLSMMFLTNIFCNVAFGAIGDRIGWRKTIALFGGVGCAVTTLLLYLVPKTIGPNYPLSLLAAMLYGATLAGYVPLSALIPSLSPANRGAAMSILTLGAGAASWAGPAIAGILLPRFGAGGVMWAYSALYLLSAALIPFLKPKQI